jgi:cytochrome P450
MQRVVNYDMEYEEFKFKKNDQIFILFANILRNENEFDKPDHFIPERWINKPVEYQNIVFGVGPQQCPSLNITPLYYKSIIINLLTKYDYKCNYPILKDKKIPYINPYSIDFSIK